jgi:hypothetical protein
VSGSGTQRTAHGRAIGVATIVIIQESSRGPVLLNYSLEEYEWEYSPASTSPDGLLQSMDQLTLGQSTSAAMEVSNSFPL